MDEHLNGIIAMLYYHWPLEWIEEQLLISRRKIYNTIHKYDLPRKRGRYQMSDRDKTIIQDYQDGSTVKELSRDHDISEKRVREIVGIENNPHY